MHKLREERLEHPIQHKEPGFGYAVNQWLAISLMLTFGLG